ncbi:hypothetical protein MSSIT_1865 [Methanosarcina siciliae T4/M]|uniref:Novel STAND NTPase 3 domain-containing protein n=1 Tax=Methanosarcina siciliae T4/M TaxID=1434120 RepID=A0A0E3P6Z7_9EURY|nr:hypothetical protein [Methanosarcina siciliae]AKB28584.1 hypothetical protein MSSIT_1865 [Methanosarcina siciliae T4/M]
MVDTKEYYLCYIDILGFENRAKGIVDTYDLHDQNIEPSHIRHKLRQLLKNKVEDLKKRKSFIGISTGRDDWLIVSEDFQKLLISISEIIELQQDFPFEIALGSVSYQENTDFNSDSFIDEDSTIYFLKNNIIGEYSKFYKATHNESTRTTFILFTENLYQKLDYCDQEIFNPQEYKKKYLYYVDTVSFKRWAKSLNFLNTLGIPKGSIYEGIDRLFVIPKEYDEIKKILENNKVVVITGNPESGKTFTAVRLLWEYYLKEYQPVWKRAENSLHEKKKGFEKIDSDLKEKQIFYFEDPFGENKYEKIELLEKEIKAIIDKIREFENIYLIITSRSEVFQEFNSHNYSIDFGKVVQKLNAKSNFQDYNEREKLLLMWAKKNRCIWLSDVELKTYILEQLKLPISLPTPLRIRDFCVTSRNITDSAILHEKIIEKSRDAAVSFADEISTLSEDKILFLSFPFTSGSFKLEFVKEKYIEMVQEFGIKDALSSSSVIEWFRGDKIEIFNDRIRFSHPTYLQSLKYLLTAKECSTTIFPEIYSKFLWKLAEDENAAGYISRVIADNYSNLPNEIQGLLFTLAKSDSAKRSVVRTLVYNYSNLPKEAQTLLHDLYMEEGLKKDIARAITDYFYVVPEELKTLLFDMSHDNKVAGHLARALTDNYNNLSDEAKNLIIEIYKTENFDKDIARAIIENYRVLPDHLKCVLFNMLEKEEYRSHIAKAIADKCQNIPTDVFEYSLLKLSNDEKCEKFVARAIIKNFDNTSDKLKNILYKCLDDSPNTKYIVQSIEMNFEKLSADSRAIILSQLSNNEKTAKYAAKISSKL